MAKHQHQQYQQQSLPHPTAPPTPVAKAPVPEPEPRWWLAIGTVEGNKHAVAWMKTQGTRVLECHFLDSHYGPMPLRDAALAEDTWEEASYPALFHGTPPRTVGQGMLEFGRAIGFHKAPNGKTAAVEVEVEGNRLLCGEGDFKTIYLGGRQDAWNELQAHAAHHLLPNWQSERRRAARSR